MQKSNGGRIPTEVKFEDTPLEGMRIEIQDERSGLSSCGLIVEFYESVIGKASERHEGGSRSPTPT